MSKPLPPIADVRGAALRSADEISARIVAGGYRATLSDVEELRNHVRKLADALDPAAGRVVEIPDGLTVTTLALAGGHCARVMPCGCRGERHALACAFWIPDA